MKKRALTLLMTLIMCLSICVPAMASNVELISEENSVSSSDFKDAKVKINEREIEENLLATVKHIEQVELARTMESIYAQLEAQDAMDMLDVYEAIVAPMIRNQVYAEFGIDTVQPLSDEEEVGFYAPNGGTVSYDYPRGAGAVPVPVSVTCMTKEQSTECVGELAVRPIVLKNLSYSSILMACIGEIPKFSKFGKYLSAPSLAISAILESIAIVNDLQIKDIKTCGWRTMMIKTYRFADGSFSTAIIGWGTTGPTDMIYMPTGMTIYEAEFNAHVG